MVRKSDGHPAAHAGDAKASAARSAADRSASARKAAPTCKRNAWSHASHSNSWLPADVTYFAKSTEVQMSSETKVRYFS